MIYRYIFLCWSFTLAASTSQELFLQGNEYYKQKEYAKALSHYEKIPNKGAAVWHNMGNSAYKNGNTVHAQLYWKRATKQSEKQFPILIIQILFFCTFSVFLIFVRPLILKKKYRMLIACSLITLTTGLLAYNAYAEYSCKKGLTIDDNSIAYVGPDAGFHEVNNSGRN